MTYEEEFVRNMAASLRERKQERYRTVVKNYGGGSTTRLTADWPTTITSPTAVLRYSLSAMRARSRQQAINNDYVRRFLWMVGINLIGPNGITLQCKAKWPDGKLDKWANDAIETAYYKWGEKGSYDVTGTLSMIDGDRLGVQTVARDGEYLCRIIEGFDNEWDFAVQFYEADYLDESLNVTRLNNGGSIRMGVEFDKWFRPVAYHLLTDHPGDSVWTYNSRQYVRVPAQDIVHPFIHERFSQPRGVPWTHSALTRLNNLGAYEEAEIIAARIGASTMGIWEQDPNNPPDPNTSPGQDDTDSDGTPIMEMEPGIFAKAPAGYQFKPFDPNRPAGNFAPFMKAALRGISSGLLVSYNSLASDLEGVNYSSIRAGVLEERDCWKLQQAWWIENFKTPIYRRWLRWQLLRGKIATPRGALPLSKLDKFAAVQWQPRTWPWVDPAKDIDAKVTALKSKLTSWSRALAEEGIDLEEHCAELQRDQEIAARYGVELRIDEPAAKPPDKDPNREEENEGGQEKQPRPESAGGSQ